MADRLDVIAEMINKAPLATMPELKTLLALILEELRELREECEHLSQLW